MRISDAPSDDDVAAWHATGMFHLRRYEAKVRDDGVDHYHEMAEAFAKCFIAGAEVPDRAAHVAAIVAADTAREMYLAARESSDAASLTAVAQLWLRIIAAASADVETRGRYKDSLSRTLRARFTRTGDPADLDAAIAIGRQAVAETLDDDELLPYIVFHLSGALVRRFEIAGDESDLNAAIGGYQRALDSARLDDEQRYGQCASSLAVCLRLRFERLGDPADLDRGITLGREAVEAAGTMAETAHETMSVRRSIVASALMRRYEEGGDPADLDASIGTYREALGGLVAQDLRAVWLSHLGAALVTRYLRSGIRADLDEAIVNSREAVALAGDTAPDLAIYLGNLGRALLAQVDVRGGMSSLDEAVAVLRRALDAAPPGHRFRGTVQFNLGLALEARFTWTGELAELDEAIILIEQALREEPDRWLLRPACLYVLTLALRHRHKASGDHTDLEAAAAVGRRLVDATPVGHPQRRIFLMGYADMRTDEFYATRRREDLDEAIGVYRQALAHAPEGSPGALSARIELARALRIRFEESSEHADLDEARAVLRHAAEESDDGLADGGSSLLNLGRLLREDFERTGELPDVEEAVTVLRRALAAAAAAGQGLAEYQSQLGIALRLWSERTGRIGDADEAFALHQAAVDATPAANPLAGTHRLELGSALALSFHTSQDAVGSEDPLPQPTRTRLLGSVAEYIHVDTSACLSEAALADVHALERLLAEDANPDIQAWGMVGSFYWFRGLMQPARSQGRKDGVDAAIRAYIPVFIAGGDIYDDDDLRRVVADAVADEVARQRFEQAARTMELRIVTETLDLWRRVQRVRGDAEPAIRARDQWAIGSLLLMRYLGGGDRVDLEDAIAQIGQAAADLPPRHSDGPRIRATLADALRARFMLTGDRADLEKSVDAGSWAVRRGRRGPNIETFRIQFGAALVTRSMVTGDADDLTQGIGLLTRSTRALPSGDTDRAIGLTGLCEGLLVRHRRASDAADVQRAIDAAASALETLPDGHPSHLLAAAGLASALAAGSSPGDLDEAIALVEEGLRRTPGQHPSRVRALAGLAGALLGRFDSDGALADLDSAIEAGTQALDATPPGSPGRAHLAAITCRALLSRFDQSGDTSDLDAAITAGRIAVAAAPPVTQEVATHLSMLGLALHRRFERTGDPGCLDEAIVVTRQAVANVPRKHPTRGHLEARLAAALRTRCEATADSAELDSAVALTRRAVDAVPVGQPGRSLCLAELGLTLLARFGKSDGRLDLDEAITLLRAATPLIADPAQAKYLKSLGDALAVRSALDSDLDSALDRDEAIRCHTRVAQAILAPARLRIASARAGAELAAFQQPRHAAELLEGAVRLLPRIASRRISRVDQQHALSQFAFLASDAAALALAADQPDTSAPADPAARALGLLELGRGVLHGQAISTRGDITELLTKHPALGTRFLRLRDVLDKPPDIASERDGRPGAVNEFEAVTEEIRGHSGFESFLLPPEPDHLTRQASAGPIVAFNVSRYRSDALIVTAEAVTHVLLPGLDQRTLAAQVAAFNQALDASGSGVRDPGMTESVERAAEDKLSQVLEWLWDVAAEPVLRHLGHVEPHANDTPWPRVWWMPGGLLGLLPLHAAGHHRRAGAGMTVLDRVVSSYTPTIRALAHSREHADIRPPARSLIVAMPATPGELDLPGAEQEATTLAELLPSPVVLIEHPDTVTDQTPTRDAVLRHLPSAGIAHFSCHAASHPDDPSKSQILLHDHQEKPFTVASLLPIRLDRAQLAFLSACQTGRIDVIDLADEAIHLASAFQLAGYPHVIASLWPIYDQVAKSVAETFYLALRTGPQTFDLSASALALHHTVRALRDQWRLAGTPSLWAPFTHTGA